MGNFENGLNILNATVCVVVEFKLDQENSTAQLQQMVEQIVLATGLKHANVLSIHALYGGFGKWSNYLTCSVSCGRGVQFRERNCDSPPPQYGGKDCDGPSRENRSCWETECRGSFKKKFFF